MADKKFDQDFTELAAPDNSSRLMISKLDGAIRKTYWITWDKFTGPSITSAAFTGDDLVFTKDDNTTVTLVGGKTSLKGDKGDTGATGAKGDTGPTGPQGIQGIQGVAGNGIASVTTNKVGKTTTVTITEDDSTVTNFNIIDGEDGIGAGDMLKSVYDPNNKVADAFSMDNMVETATKKILTDAERTNLGNQSGTNTGDETQATIKTKLGAATTSLDGYITSTDWTTFNNKQTALSKAIGTEVDAGSDDTKYVTSKAIKDSKLSYTDGAETLTNKTFDDATTNKQVSTPSNPASGYNKLYFKSDGKLYYLDSNGTETAVGSGTGTSSFLATQIFF